MKRGESIIQSFFNCNNKTTLQQVQKQNRNQDESFSLNVIANEVDPLTVINVFIINSEIAF